MKSQYAEHLITTKHESSNIETNINILIMKTKQKLKVQEDFKHFINITKKIEINC